MFGSAAYLRAIAHVLQSVEDRLDSMERQLRRIMTSQEHIDADVQALTDGLAAILAEIELLKSQTGAEVLDFTGLDAVTAGITAVTAPVEPPVDPTA